VTGPRELLAALDALQLPWAPAEPDFLPVSHAALAPPAEASPKRPPLGWADVRATRLAAGLTRAELGALLGVGEARVRRMESSASTPRLTRLEEDVVRLLCLALEPMVNAHDRHRWARGLAEVAQARRPMSAVLQMLSDGARWRGGEEGAT
jgi:hypothetical protein